MWHGGDRVRVTPVVAAPWGGVDFAASVVVCCLMVVGWVWVLLS